METVITNTDVLIYLGIAVAAVLLIVLYHVLFIVVDLRKVLRRIETITREVETVIMKPLHAADFIVDSIVQFIESKSDEKPKNKKK